MLGVALLCGCRASSIEPSPAPSTTTVESATPSASVIASAVPTTTASAAPMSAEDLIRTRPYRLESPDGDGGAMPLVVLLHGYGSSGDGHESYFNLAKLAKAHGVMLAIPNGTRDHKGLLYWNASEACCDFDKAPVDDVAYIDAILDDVAKKKPLDATRVYIVGHSNGAFMAHRYACERSTRVAAIVALAGVPWADPARCEGHGVSVLQVHGDADAVIAYAGGKSFGNQEPYPSAESAVEMWAARDGCSARHSAGPAVDFDLGVPGPETTREAYTCPAGVDVALWRMHGSSHVPRLDARFVNAALDWLLAHKRSLHSK